ncbi:hypothetical protein GCM10009551_099210 [Nocardiopsis tropica]
MTTLAGGLTARYLLLDIRRQLRNRQTLLITTLLPAVLYLALSRQRGVEATSPPGR